MTSIENCEDFIARSRRGVLSALEERQFRELLERSLEARLLYEAGNAFERESSVMPGDDARLERIIRKLHSGSKRRRVHTLARGTGVGVILGLIVVGAAAAAVNYSKGLTTPPEPAPAPSSANASRGARHPAPFKPSTASSSVTPEASSGASAELPVHVPASPKPVAAPALPREAQSARANPSSIGRFEDVVEPAAPAATPSDLFSEANRARVQGDVAHALAVYGRLLGEFSTSREAQAARISAGMLHLQQGHTKQALQEFQTYVANGGPMMAEALWGEARAWAALEQPENERQALSRIVLQYPQSAYAASARARLSR